MRRILLYIIVLAVLLVVPAKGADVGKLRPVETIAIYKEDDAYVIATDTGDLGRGADLIKALQSLKATTPAIIYLDTADYLLVSEQALEEIEALDGKLRNSVQLYLFKGKVNLKDASKFLRVHGDGPSLKAYEKGVKLQTLDCQEERIRIT